MREYAKKDTGFTLIEILVAVTIVGIAFAIIAHGYISLTGLVRQIREYQVVDSFANNKLNQVVRKIDPGVIGYHDLGLMEVDWQVIDLDMGDGVRRVTITVEWSGRRGPRTYQLTTLTEGGTYASDY